MTSGKETQNLKSKLDGEQLDLSLSDISVVPVREIAALKKVADLDLSSNHIVTLPDDFCTLRNLVKLDLSSNKLYSLPEQFGKLEHLQHLDLYRNNLQALPISFCHLKHLRWLDVKDNPLEDSLRKVAGDCLEPKQCREAATKVVQHMQRLNTEKERERQKELKKQREIEASERMKEDEHKRAKAAEKKKEKERRKEVKNVRQEEHVKKQKSETASKAPTQKERVATKSEKLAKKKQGRGILGCVCCLVSVIFWTLFISILLALALSLTLYANCSQPSGREFIPQTRPLCEDVYQMLQTGRISAPNWDYKASMRESGIALQRFANLVVDAIQQFDYVGWKDAVVDLTVTCRDTAVHFFLWTYENGSEIAKPIMKQLVDWFWVAVAATLLILELAFQYAVQIAKWTVETISDVIGNFPAYVEKAKYYWQHLK